MSTKTRNLSNIQGVNVPAPDSTGFTSNKIESFPSDAAYESAILPALPTVGDIYFNTTIKSLREHNGTVWQHDKLQVDTQTDAVKTGADQDITPANNQIIRFTSGTLTSIRGIIPGVQTFLFLVNDQASQAISIQNQAAGATAANRIITGTSADFSLAAGKIVGLSYDSAALRWRISGGGAGGGLQPLAVAAGPVSGVAGTHYLTDTTAGAFTINLPAGTVGATIRVTDATEKWGVNNLTIAPFAGQTIDTLTAGESLVCDVIRGWVELNWTGTFWAFNSLASTQVSEASATSPGILTTGAQSIAGPKNFLGGLVGNSTGTASLTGQIGEVLRSAVTTLSNVAPAGQYGDASNISLTIGLFRIDAKFFVDRTGATLAAGGALLHGVSTTSGNFSTELSMPFNAAAIQYISLTASIQHCPMVSFLVRCNGSTITRVEDNVTMAAGTTLYHKVYADGYTVATPTFKSSLTATRIA